MADRIDQLTIGSSSYDIDLPIDNEVKTNTSFSLMSVSSVAGSSTSGSYLSVRWYVSNKTAEFTAPYDGMKIAVKIPRVGVGTAGVVLSINGNTAANYHPVAYNVNTVLTTHFPANSVKIFTYDASATMDCYLTSNTKSTITGVWKADSNYYSDSDTKVRQYQAGTAARTGTQYPILTRYAVTDKAGTYDANYARYSTNTYIDTSTGNIYAPNLGTASAKAFTESVTENSTDLVTSGAVWAAIDGLPEPMVFKGTLGTGGTITDLPTAAAANEGHTYKVITAGTYASQAAKIGDIFISNGSAWVLVPAGDDVEDTWRNIKVNGTELLGTGISTGAVNFKNGSNITVSGSGNDITIAASVPSSTGDLTNDRFVRYDTDAQGLTTTQKSNARTNIGAGTSNFSGNYNDLSNKPTFSFSNGVLTITTNEA